MAGARRVATRQRGSSALLSFLRERLSSRPPPRADRPPAVAPQEE